MTPPTIIICGVSGSGKTTVGRALADILRYAFVDADDLHDPGAVVKMARGEPLDDADRAPWLARVAVEAARVRAAGEGVVVACSALRIAYRDQLRLGAPGATFVLLEVSPAEAARRVAARIGHFMPASLITSQFETLEAPAPHESDMTVVVGSPPATITAEAIARRLA